MHTTILDSFGTKSENSISVGTQINHTSIYPKPVLTELEKLTDKYVDNESIKQLEHGYPDKSLKPQPIKRIHKTQL